MDQAELDDYRPQHRRTTTASFVIVVLVSVGIGLGVAAAWSFLGGVGVAVALFFVGLELHMRWDKARWLKRFPELADPRVQWRKR